MRRKVFAILFIGILILFAGHQARAFESSYFSVRVEGNGADIIFLHGFASSPEVWADLPNEISQNFRLHFVSISGFAGTAPPEVIPESYLNTVRDEIARYIDSENLKQPTLIGHSMGGLVSLLVASQENQKIGKVIVVDALPFYSLLFNPYATTEQILPRAKALEGQLIELDDQEFERQAEASASILTKNGDKKELLIKWSNQSDRRVYAKFLSEIMAYDARPDTKAIACPVTVLYAYDDAMGVPETQLKHIYSTAYANLINVRIKRIPDSFHFVMWDQPKNFYREVIQALIPDANPILKNRKTE